MLLPSANDNAVERTLRKLQSNYRSTCVSTGMQARRCLSELGYSRTCFKDIAVGFSNLWSTHLKWPRSSLHWSFCQTFWEFCTLFVCTVAAHHFVSYLISSPLLPSTSPLFPPLLLWSFLLRSYASLLYPALLYFFTPQPRLSGLVDAVMNHPSALDFLAKTEEKHSLPKMRYPFHPLVHHIFFRCFLLK